MKWLSFFAACVCICPTPIPASTPPAVATATPTAAEGGYEGVTVLAAMSPKFDRRKPGERYSPCENAIRSLRRRPRPGFQTLWATFGRDTGCLKKFTRRYRRRPHMVQVALSNETCRDGPNPCYRQELYRGLSVRRYNRLLARGKARRTYARIRRIAAALAKVGNPRTLFVLSTGLEDEYTFSAYQNLLAHVRADWPYLVVRNPLRFFQPHRGADLRELHTADGALCGGSDLASLDGHDVDERGARAFVRAARRGGCYGAFLFRGRWQGRFRGQGFLPPRRRSFLFDDSDIRFVKFAFGG